MPDSTTKKPRILLAGAPFGRNHIGEEALVECMVNLLRELRPDAEIWVSTDDQAATRKKLDVMTYPLFGFDPPGFDPVSMRQGIRDSDAFIWSSATGLSAASNVPLELLQHAIDLGKTTAVFCTAMNDEPAPALDERRPNKQHILFDLLKQLTFGRIDLGEAFERKRIEATHSTMKRTLPKTNLVILRDAQSKAQLSQILGETAAIHLASDPVITLACPDIDRCRFPDATLRCLERNQPKIGLCLSADPVAKHMSALQERFGQLISERGVKLVGIPANPLIDTAFLNEFRQGLTHPNEMHIIEGTYEPDEINAAISRMDVVVSSRLPLLTLASITLTPFVGIGGGAQVTEFTGQFGLPDLGNVEELDVGQLSDEILRLMDHRAAFRSTAKTIRLEMLNRLKEAKGQLKALLSEL